MLWGVLFAIISSLSFGISNVYWKRAAVNDSFSRIVFYRGVLTLSVFLILLFSLRMGHASFSFLIIHNAALSDIAFAIILCAVCSLGLVCYLQSLRYSPVSISVPLSSINIFSILTAVFVLGETFRQSYYAAFLLAACGVVLLHQKGGTHAKGLNKGVLYSLLASFFWGVTYALFKIPATTIGALPLALILESCVTVTAFIWNKAERPQHAIQQLLPPVTQFKHYMVLAVLLICGTLFYNLAIQRTEVLLLNLLGNTSIITSVLLGVLVEKEHLSYRRMLGIVLILLSLLVVQVF